MLLEGHFQPGERIREVPLAAELGVSRIPLRLVLERLAHEGLLVVRPTRGFVVQRFFTADIYDAIELRGLLEGMAARLTAERVQSPADTACLISSGRGVHEALAAAALCERSGVNVGVVDMPSIDQELLCDLLNSGRLLVFAEQNNGYIWQNFLQIVYTNRGSIRLENLRNVATINTLDANSRPQFIHSGTYEELVDAFGLSPAAIARTVCDRLGDRT